MEVLIMAIAVLPYQEYDSRSSIELVMKLI